MKENAAKNDSRKNEWGGTMVAEAEVMVDWAVSKTGSIYRAYDPDRWDLPNCFDCSSLGVRAHRAAGMYVPNDVRNTVGIYEYAASVGALVSVDKAIATRGAGLLKGGAHGFGAAGHYAISLGGGQEMAAHGTRSGVHPGPVNRSFYQDGIIWPASMMHYAALDPPFDPKVLEALVALEQWKDRVSAKPLHYKGDRPLDTATLNQLLVGWAVLDEAFIHSQVYGKDTAGALNHFKRLRGFKNRDGKVCGSEAATALLAPPK